MPNYLYYWGKAGSDGWHPAALHSLDVAAVVNVLLVKGNYSRIFLPYFESEAECVALITWLAAIHDIGKWHDYFQAKLPSLAQENLRRIPTTGHDNHGIAGWSLFKHKNPIPSEQWIGEYVEESLEALFAATTGHHGRAPKAKPFLWSASREGLTDAKHFLKDVSLLLLPESVRLPEVEDVENFSHLINGIIILGDWLGSNNSVFKYEKPTDIQTYWSAIQPRAIYCVEYHGFLPNPPKQAPFPWSTFNPKIQTPTALQSVARSTPIPSEGTLFIIEDATGSGKTEAALQLAFRLISRGKGNNIYFALPTMATADGIFDRFPKNLIQNWYIGDQPATNVLSHSAARFRTKSQRYAEDATTVAQRWLQSTKKAAIFADFGVGTIDQALMAVLPVKHYGLRLFAVVNSVLIIDEVHAYDTYTNELLLELLRTHAKFGGSAILLSATIPKDLKAKLIQCYCKDSHKQSTDYPLITTVASSGIRENSPLQTKFAKNRGLRVPVQIVNTLGNAHQLLIQSHRAGHCAVWIRNTVNDARTAYLALCESIGPDNVTLFHSRFTITDRARIQSAILKRFGRSTDIQTVNDRKGKIVIATQVIEQSLDLDFDVMLSDIAPIDALIQRAGRLQRHERGPRISPVLHVIAPVFTETPTVDWLNPISKGTGYVYGSHGVLWRTLRALNEYKRIEIPSLARKLIADVYDLNECPTALQKRDTLNENKIHKERSLSKRNLISIDDGFQQSSSNQLTDSGHHTPTRLGNSLRLRLAHQVNGKLHPLGTDDWRKSDVSCPAFQLRKIQWPTVDDSLLRSMPDKGHWSQLVELHRTLEGVWIAEVSNTTITYSSCQGLSISRAI